MLVHVTALLEHRLLGSTVDDAAGECFDKVGKLIGLPYPAGPEMDRLSEHGTFIVTAATFNKEHFFRGEARLTVLEDELLRLAKQYGVIVEAWAIFSNHYHI